MKITNIKPAPGKFANGFQYFCPDCGMFFSIQVMDITDSGCMVSICPHCGEDSLITTIDQLLRCCTMHGTDPVNFYHAFPPDEPIPHSCTKATPKQVEWIIGCVLNDKREKLPITVKSLAAELGYKEETIRKVFEELHITETGGNL
ncbi:MAG: hypothetical protein LBI04_04280 [Treponema sp.]|nr:hypothetical protein [Treponema sp.]